MSLCSTTSSLRRNRTRTSTNYPFAPCSPRMTRRSRAMASPQTTTNYTCAFCSDLASDAQRATLCSRHLRPSWRSRALCSSLAARTRTRRRPRRRPERMRKTRKTRRKSQLAMLFSTDENEKDELPLARSLVRRRKTHETSDSEQERLHLSQDYKTTRKGLARDRSNLRVLDRRKKERPRQLRGSPPSAGCTIGRG